MRADSAPSACGKREHDRGDRQQGATGEQRRKTGHDLQIHHEKEEHAAQRRVHEQVTRLAAVNWGLRKIRGGTIGYGLRTSFTTKPPSATRPQR